MLTTLLLGGFAALFTEQVAVVSGYDCTSGCSIPDSYVNDNWCDCDDCDDERFWTCDTCSSAGCPVNCTNYKICDGSGDNSGDYFYCSNGCPIVSMYYNDSWCDCSQCEDELQWTCSSCSGGCPNATQCDASYAGYCSSITLSTTLVTEETTSSPTVRETTMTPDSFTTTQDYYTCDDGCVIPWIYRNDGWCDCSDCEDETYWTCDTCSSAGCPSNCGVYTNCDGSGDNSTDYFYCDGGCPIPSGWYNDSYCDCPSCEDEPDWTCSTCGGCPGFNECGDWQFCTPSNTESPSTTNTFSTTNTRYTTNTPETTNLPYTTNSTSDYYTCYDGCVIPKIYLDDGWCDCSECEDETYWTCDTCSSAGCSSDCGVYRYCDGSGDNSTNYFYCNSGCAIPSGWYNDSYCDCPSCEDEPDWTCSTCGGCPDFDQCGDWQLCSSSNTESPSTTNTFSTTNTPETTNSPDATNSTSDYYTCDDGCVIPRIYQDDGWCDCSDCEDETYWTCDTCSSIACPSNCGVYTLCDGSGDNSTDYFYCDGGCPIPSGYYNDSWCDCPSCEDEPDWTCSTCGGCPDFDQCGDWQFCSSPNTEAPSTTNAPETTNSQDYYTCDDGCVIPRIYQDDGWCDCSECEDETYWTCDTCSSAGCPSNCGVYTNCDGSGDNSTDYFYCNSGCGVPSGWYNDSYCDCPSCEDEPDWSCTTCGGCPGYYECGDWQSCSTNSNENNTSTYSPDIDTTASPFTCEDGCNVPASYYNNSWCDCSQCEDEPNWTCYACGGCPDVDECSDGVNCKSEDDDDDDDYTTTAEGGSNDTGNEGATLIIWHSIVAVIVICIANTIYVAL